MGPFTRALQPKPIGNTVEYLPVFTVDGDVETGAFISPMQPTDLVDRFDRWSVGTYAPCGGWRTYVVNAQRRTMLLLVRWMKRSHNDGGYRVASPLYGVLKPRHDATARVGR